MICMMAFYNILLYMNYLSNVQILLRQEMTWNVPTWNMKQMNISLSHFIITPHEYMFKPFHNNPSLTLYENSVTISV